MSATRRTFRPSPLLVGSGLLHVGVLAALVRWPTLWSSLLLTLLADHALITVAGLWPRSTLLGPNCRRLGDAGSRQRAVALTFDDGPEPGVTPQVLDLLERAGARATFFLIGERAAREPGLVRAIADAGHTIANHTWSHSKAFALLPPRAIAAELDRTQDLLATLTGNSPVFFRPPAGIRNVLLEPLLARRGLHLASWTRRGLDAFAHDAETVYRRLAYALSPGDILLLHDGQLTGVQQRRSSSQGPLALAVLPRLLETLARKRLTSMALTSALLEPSSLG
jgi:peptidoglycan/xylan/chitin deacetylase (PgdA/CDA1 family)